MSSLNQVQLIGNIGKDPELAFTKSGVAYCRASIATKESWSDQGGERREETEWHNVVFWKKQAENVAKYCHKGSKIFVQGRLRTRSWESGGQKHYATDVQAQEVKFLGGNRREESPPKQSRPGTGKPVNAPPVMGDHELPDDTPF